MKSFVTLVALLGLASCASLFHRGSGQEPLRLCIQNGTVGYGTLVAHAGLIRFDVTSGQEVCKPIAEISSSLTVTAQTLGGGSAGPLSFSASVPAGGARCWRWRLTNAPGSEADLMPCDLSPSSDQSSGGSGGSI
jgi:hypothetical protein